MDKMNYKKGTLVSAMYNMLEIEGVIDYEDERCVITSTEGNICFPLSDCTDVKAITGIDRVSRGYLASEREKILIDRILRRV